MPPKPSQNKVTTPGNFLLSIFHKAYSDLISDLQKSKILPAKAVSDISLNQSILNEAIKNCLKDINRLDQFHTSPANSKPDRHKYIGFFSRWVAKLRPIQCIDSHHVSPRQAMFNAFLAYYILARGMRKGAKPVPLKVVEALIYQFHFRDIPSEHMSIQTCLLEQATGFKAPA